jgi:hypothetical protein
MSISLSEGLTVVVRTQVWFDSCPHGKAGVLGGSRSIMVNKLVFCILPIFFKWRFEFGVGAGIGFCLCACLRWNGGGWRSKKVGKRSYDLSPFLTNSEPKSVPTPSTSVFIATLLILAVVISSGGRRKVHCIQLSLSLSLSLHESTRVCTRSKFLSCLLLPFLYWPRFY